MEVKPNWSLMMMNAADLHRQARNLYSEAQMIRRFEQDSGGARCTADAHPTHIHRYSEADLPS